MRVTVRPAKRDGVLRTIFDHELAVGNVAGSAPGATISIDADPLHRKSRYRDNSHYRYDIFLSVEEIAGLARQIASS
ncbi:hypothetical protein ATER59S_00955 [Aquamicrobium terrae]